MKSSIAAARAECAERQKVISANAKLKRIAFNEKLKAEMAAARAAAKKECAEWIRAIKAGEARVPSGSKKKAAKPKKSVRTPRMRAAKPTLRVESGGKVASGNKPPVNRRTPRMRAVKPAQSKADGKRVSRPKSGAKLERDFAGDLARAFRRLDPKDRRMVSLYELRAAMPSYSKKEFDRGLAAVIDSGGFQPATIDGQLPADIVRAGLKHRGTKFTFLIARDDFK